MREHYANMNNRESKLLSLHSEEDVARHSVTLSKLYQKLARTESVGDKQVYEEASSNSSDNVEDMYNRMLQDSDDEREEKNNQSINAAIKTKHQKQAVLPRNVSQDEIQKSKPSNHSSSCNDIDQHSKERIENNAHLSEENSNDLGERIAISNIAPQ